MYTPKKTHTRISSTNIKKLKTKTEDKSIKKKEKKGIFIHPQIVSLGTALNQGTINDIRTK